MVMLNAELIVPGDHDTTVQFAAHHFINIARESIQDHDAFYVALSGGSTPREIYEILAHSPYDTEIDWEKVHLFWSDERNVPPDHKESNYRMAREAMLAHVPVPREKIHPMPVDGAPEGVFLTGAMPCLTNRIS